MKKKFSIKWNSSLSETCGKLFIGGFFIFIVVVTITTFWCFISLLLDKLS